MSVKRSPKAISKNFGPESINIEIECALTPLFLSVAFFFFYDFFGQIIDTRGIMSSYDEIFLKIAVIDRLSIQKIVAIDYFM